MQIIGRTAPFVLAARRMAGGLPDVCGGFGAGGTGCGGHAGEAEAARVGGLRRRRDASLSTLSESSFVGVGKSRRGAS